MLQHRAVAPQGGGPAQPLHIVHGLAAGLRHGGPLAFFLAHFIDLRAQGAHALVQRRLGRALLAQNRRADLLKQPWVAQRAAADHNAVTAGFLQQRSRTVSGGHIAVGQHRNGHRLLDSRDCRRVDGRDIHLLPRAAVYGDEIRAIGLDLLCNLCAGQVVGVPADAHLDGQRGILAQRPAGGGNHLPAERRVEQQLTARAAAGNLGRRAAHIDVEHIKPDALFPDKVYRFFQCFRLCAEKLDRIQAVGVLVLQKLQRFAVTEGQRLGACHLADGPGRAVIRHQMAARRIGQPRHRRKNRACGDL